MLRYPANVYSFRNDLSLVRGIIDGSGTESPDAAALAQVEDALASASQLYWRRRYRDAIAAYKQAGILIYRFLDPAASVHAPSAYDLVSRNPALFDPLLSVATEYMNILPPQAPGTLRPRTPVDPNLLASGKSLELAGIRSSKLTTPSTAAAASDARTAVNLRAQGLTSAAAFYEKRATAGDPATAKLFLTDATVLAPAPAPRAATPEPAPAPRAAALEAVVHPAAAVERVSAATRLITAAARVVVDRPLPQALVQERTLGIESAGAVTQIAWAAGDVPALDKVKAAVYQSRVTLHILPDVLLVPKQPSDVALALPHNYYYVIPLGIAECLHALGDYAGAETYYLEAAGYAYLNQVVEVPYLWIRLAILYLDWGDSLFKAGDAQSAAPIYTHVIAFDDSVPSSALYTTANLKAAAAVARQVIAGIQNLGALSNINPQLIAVIVEVRQQLIKIKGGLNFCGVPTDTVPIWTFDYLQSVAINFANLAISAERDFISYRERADQSSLTREQLVQNATQSAAEVNAAQAQAAAASAELAAYQQGVAVAKLRAQNAQQAVTDYTNASWYGMMYQASTAQIQGGDDGEPDQLNDLANQLLSGSTISGSRGTIAGATQLAGSMINRQYEIGSMQRTAAEMQAAAAQAQAEATAAQARVDAANAAVQVAQLRSTNAQQMVDAFDNQYFTPDVWQAMGDAMYRLYQRYLGMALKVAQLMQQAYNFETDQSLKWIRASYSNVEVKGLLAADALMADIQSFTYDLVTATQGKPQPLRHTISLASQYAYEFETQFRKTGAMEFDTRVDDFDAAYPGTFAGRIDAVEVVVDGIVPVTGVSGTLTNTGVSTYRTPSIAWPANGNAPGVKYRIQSKESLVISDYQTRTDGLFYTQDPRMLRIFEGAGVASSWRLEIPRSVNDIDYGALVDVRLIFYYHARFDQDLKARVLSRLATLPGVTRRSRSLPLRWLYPDAFYRFQATGTLQLSLAASDFARNERQPKIANIALLIATSGKPAAGITVSLAAPGHAAVKGTTDANGLIASGGGAPFTPLAGGSAVGDYAITIAAADNPSWVVGGKLDISPILNIALLFEYDFTPRA